MMPRLGVLGGTFNPIHHGHLVAAAEVTEQFALERLIILPTHYPPHKQTPDLPAPHHRLTMAVLATTDHPLFTVCDLEITRPGPSYTVETMPALARRYGAEAEFFFIVGIDVFRDFASWKEAAALLRLCHFVVISRPPYEFVELRSHLERTLAAVSPGARFEPRPGLAGEQAVGLIGSPFSVYPCRVPHLEISSTEIRERVRHGRTIRYLLPDVAAQYIYQEGLYGAPGSPRK